MKRVKTKFVNCIGKIKYPIYLMVEKDNDYLWKNGKYDLWCDREIYGSAWFDIYTESVKAYESGELNEEL